MSTIVTGAATLFFLHDVADAIDLARVRSLIGDTVSAPLTRKAGTPSYVQYQQPPLAVDGRGLGMPDVGGFRVRFKVFDYGVISVALTRALPGAWDVLLEQGIGWSEDAHLPNAAQGLCRALIERIASAVTKPRQHFLAEDYIVFGVTQFDRAVDASSLLAEHGDDVAQLLRAERERLSPQERDEVLRHRISYLTTDLLVPTWNGAFVYDSDAGVQGALELLEFANSQLLEFRYYDQLLDEELARIYPQLQHAGWGLGRRYTRAARNVHALFIDVNELTDRTENSLKIVGDVYAARVFALAAARLGLDHWKANVRDKLQTLDDIYRFAVEQTGMARGELLELAIVLILVFELVLFFAGIMN